MPQWACRAGLWMLCSLQSVCLLALPGRAGWLAAVLVQAPGAARSLCAPTPAAQTSAALPQERLPSGQAPRTQPGPASSNTLGASG